MAPPEKQSDGKADGIAKGSFLAYKPWHNMIYVLEPDNCLLIYPLMDLTGIACQLFSLFIKSRFLLFTGLCLVASGAILERDPVLLVGDLLASLGLYLVFFHSMDKERR